jgi:hypothetical protein
MVGFYVAQLYLALFFLFVHTFAESITFSMCYKTNVCIVYLWIVKLSILQRLYCLICIENDSVLFLFLKMLFKKAIFIITYYF